MKMNLRKELDAFYYSTALCDLRLMNHKFIDKSITYNSLLYLELIFCLDGKATASQLAELLHISKPAVTLKINELIEQGVVISTPDPEDKRKKLLSVNEELAPKYRVYKRQDKTAIKQIKEHYTPEDIEKFCGMLRIITDINFAETEE